MTATKDVVIHVRVDKEMRDQAEKLFLNLGLTTSKAIRVFLAQAIIEQGLPFRPTAKKLTDKQILKYDNPSISTIGR